MLIDKIRPGTGIAFKGARWFSRLFLPYTDRFHFLIVRKYLPDFDDYEFIESSARKGMRHGLLFREYGNADVEVYDVNCPETVKWQAAESLLLYGKSAYDFGMVLRMVIQVPRIFFRMLMERDIRPFYADDFHYRPDGAFICTEALCQAYNEASWNIIAPDIPPLPCALKSAVFTGGLSLRYKGILRNIA